MTSDNRNDLEALADCYGVVMLDAHGRKTWEFDGRGLHDLAARCDQPAGEPVPLPEPAAWKWPSMRAPGEWTMTTNKVSADFATCSHPFVTSLYTTDQLRAHAETVAAPWKDSAMRLFQTEQQARHDRDAWQARAETAERERDAISETCAAVIADTAKHLGCKPDNEEILQAIDDLKRERDEARMMVEPVPVGERLPEEGELVIVYSADEDRGERVDFDYIEDGGWAVHAQNYDHFLMVGGAGACGPDVVCTGPAEDAPYTHWAKIPKRRAIDSTMGDSKTTVAEDVAKRRNIVDGIGGKE